MRLAILQGDNRERLREFPDNHFASCVCDPPYELGFMGKKWDRTGIAYDVEMWREVWRVLKPGAHLLAFGGARTYHRLACAVEDAGFEIRDQIMWLYGSGFPKSQDVSKAMDKLCKHRGQDFAVIDHIAGKIDVVHIPTTSLAEYWNGWGTALKPAHEPIVVARKPLEGTVVQNVLKWGTGAINCDAGRILSTGEDFTRCQYKFSYDRKRGAFSRPWMQDPAAVQKIVETKRLREQKTQTLGRWPANVIHDGSDEVLAEFEHQSRNANMHWPGNKKEVTRKSSKPFHIYGQRGEHTYMPLAVFENKGVPASAARFFYCAKASPKERNLGCEGLPELATSTYGEFSGTDNPQQTPRGSNNKRRNNHPTVKPLALMSYLVRLVTPPGGVVLDQFLGSGSTLIAAAKEGFDAVGIDQEAAYCELAAARCRGHLGMLAEIERLGSGF